MRCLFLYLICLIASTLPLQAQTSPTRLWLDTDIMIGLPENAPREVDDGIALIMALAQPQLDIVGISVITEIDYGYQVTQQLLRDYAPGRTIPVYKGSPKGDDLGTETDASRALAAALRQEKLNILALGPATNIATVLKNHPELAARIGTIVFCAGRTTGYPFRPGLRQHTVWDYNFELDVESFRVILDAGIHVVLSGYQCSEYLHLGKADVQFLRQGNKADRWLYGVLEPWMKLSLDLFGVEGFIPYDTTPLGYFTHPQYFLIERDIPIVINYRQNDADLGPRLGQDKYFLEVSREYISRWKVDFAYRTLPGFEELVIEAIKAP
ncbi:MAG: nucleoside hydrolase [Bacteroidia bacterium]|nr:nucleoside hydrolase [Bacteroidia bacterium]